MPERQTIEKAKQKLRRGKSASTAAGEFVREEMHHIREGKHGARSTKQAIAIGLSKARRAGVPLGTQRGATAQQRHSEELASKAGRQHKKPSPRRARATLHALEREPHRAASHRALAEHAHRSAVARGPKARSAAARKAVRTKGAAGRRAAARKAARTRARHR